MIALENAYKFKRDFVPVSPKNIKIEDLIDLLFRTTRLGSPNTGV